MITDFALSIMLFVCAFAVVSYVVIDEMNRKDDK